jgi:hypothetical protein
MFQEQQIEVGIAWIVVRKCDKAYNRAVRDSGGLSL